MKQLIERFPRQVDEALSQRARLAERPANALRIFFAVMFGAAVVRSWDYYTFARPVYLAVAAGWSIVFLLARTWGRDEADRKVFFTTLLDVSVINLGLLLFSVQGLFPDFNTGLYLTYFPVLAIAALRYRPALVLMAAAWAMLFYVPLSIVAGTLSWSRIAMFLVTAVVLALASRKPKAEIVKLGSDVIRVAYEKGASAKEAEMTAQTHQLLLPPPIVDLPAIWSSLKHGAGTEKGGDYYHIFETARGPLAVLGDFGGAGFEALRDVSKLHHELSMITSREPSITKILEALNKHVYEIYKGERPFTCVMVEWEGEQMRYANAGHLPTIRMSKQERVNLPVLSPAIGIDPNASFKEEIVPFPARDLFIMFTDGAFAKLTNDREKGVAEIQSLADKFNSGEVNTLCHRIFDCAQPGYEPNKDDSTVVVIRRQPGAASAAGEGKA